MWGSPRISQEKNYRRRNCNGSPRISLNSGDWPIGVEIQPQANYRSFQA